MEVDPAKDYCGDGLVMPAAGVYEIDTILLDELPPRLAPLGLPLRASRCLDLAGLGCDPAAAQQGQHRLLAERIGVEVSRTSVSRTLDCLLPIDRTDVMALAGCERR